MKNEKLELYHAAIDAYYNSDEPLMSDSEFDQLEKELVDQGLISTTENYKTLKEKIPHLTPMLSLSKISIDKESDDEFQKILNWIKERCFYNRIIEFEFQPKYDGCAVNCIYDENGNLKHILTNSNNLGGIPITDKLKDKVPFHISNENGQPTERRGECLMKKTTFIEKYQDKGYANPRNIVAGILNRNFNEKDIGIYNDLDIVLFESKQDRTWKKVTLPFTRSIYHNKFDPTDIITVDDIRRIYMEFKYHRQTSEYQLDGIVIKVNDNEVRNDLGENDHHPEWAVAIKFPPTQVETVVEDIQWNVKKSELNPIIILKPVELDGTWVSRANGVNAQWLINNGIAPGKTVKVMKRGDIIPQAFGIDENLTGSEIDSILPKQCPICGSELDMEDIMHIKCKNSECEGVLYSKFVASINCFKVEYLGGALIERLYDAGMREGYEILITDICEFLNESHANTKKVQQQLNEIKEVSLEQLIVSLQIPNCGWSTASELAKMYNKLDYSTHGLQKSIFDDFQENYIDKLDSIIENLKEHGINIKQEEKPETNSETVYYEMTGSPKVFGFGTKEAFVEFAKSKNYVHSNITKKSGSEFVLFTDDLSSSTGKMGKAKKQGITIKLYGDIRNE